MMKDPDSRESRREERKPSLQTASRLVARRKHLSMKQEALNGPACFTHCELGLFLFFSYFFRV